MYVGTPPIIATASIELAAGVSGLLKQVRLMLPLTCPSFSKPKCSQPLRGQGAVIPASGAKSVPIPHFDSRRT